MPPPTEVNGTTHHVTYSSRLDPLIIEDIVASAEEFSLEYGKATCTPFKPVEDGKIPPLGLPSLNAGICLFMLIWSRHRKSCHVTVS